MPPAVRQPAPESLKEIARDENRDQVNLDTGYPGHAAHKLCLRRVPLCLSEWWVPGGLLGLLPLHAAGYHTDPAAAPGRLTVMDRAPARGPALPQNPSCPAHRPRPRRL
jgi:hypothetical protein